MKRKENKKLIDKTSGMRREQDRKFAVEALGLKHADSCMPYQTAEKGKDPKRGNEG